MKFMICRLNPQIECEEIGEMQVDVTWSLYLCCVKAVLQSLSPFVGLLPLTPFTRTPPLPPFCLLLSELGLRTYRTMMQWCSSNNDGLLLATKITEEYSEASPRENVKTIGHARLDGIRTSVEEASQCDRDLFITCRRLSQAQSP